MLCTARNIIDRTHYVRLIDLEAEHRRCCASQAIDDLRHALQNDARGAVAVLERELNGQIANMPALVREGVSRAHMNDFLCLRPLFPPSERSQAPSTRRESPGLCSFALLPPVPTIAPPTRFGRSPPYEPCRRCRSCRGVTAEPALQCLPGDVSRSRDGLPPSRAPSDLIAARTAGMHQGDERAIAGASCGRSVRRD